MSQQGRGEKDPALQPQLSEEEIELLGSTAHFRYRQARTPGLLQASASEQLIFFCLLLALGTVLYIHLDIRPFLPVRVSPSLRAPWTGLALLAMAIGGLKVLAFVVPVAYGAIARVGVSFWRRLVASEPRIVCP